MPILLQELGTQLPILLQKLGTQFPIILGNFTILREIFIPKQRFLENSLTKILRKWRTEGSVDNLSPRFLESRRMFCLKRVKTENNYLKSKEHHSNLKTTSGSHSGLVTSIQAQKSHAAVSLKVHWHEVLVFYFFPA